MTVYTVERRCYLLLLVGIVCLVALLSPTGVHAATANGTVQDCIGENKDCTGELQEPQNDPATNPLPAEEQDEQEARFKTSAWDYIKVFFALAFVIGLLLFVLRFINKRNRRYETSKLMHNLGGLSLGQQKSIQLVKIGERYYVVGVGNDITLLKELTDKEEIERLVQIYNEEPDLSTGSIAEWIRNRLVKRQQANPYEREENQSANFNSMFQSKIDEIQAERKRHVRRLTEKERDRNE